MRKIIFPLTFLLIFLPSCRKKDCIGAEKATFKDLTGLDGCGYVIELENGKRLEPVNLSEFSITPVNGSKIWVKYHLFEGGSICMVGDLVEVDCISERD